MLGHIAQSLGGALPGAKAAVQPRQVIEVNTQTSEMNFTGTIPPGAKFVFAEILAKGAWGGGAGGNTVNPGGGGGGGSDAIIPCIPGQTYSGTLTSVSVGTAGTCSATINGTTISAQDGRTSTGNRVGGLGGSGKYPGSNGADSENVAGASSQGGKGGGRLSAANATTAGQMSRPGNGGWGTGDVRRLGGTAICLLSFFESFDDALEFAKAVYGGNWQP